ncbi:cysteate synthase [Actinocatenispora thailandica]|uniref:Cysteate synthase n=1 Tax=Actinocatenispora thailandica TaxID=227318 RepID=A0A7R7DLW0_9ACTN|nr:cysteate synthase [Actinocatenispora thailandica]
MEPAAGPRGRAHDPAYHVVCPVCSWRSVDDGLILDCPSRHEPALLQVDPASRAVPAGPDPGPFRYRSWLPVRRDVPNASGTVVYRSTALAGELGLRRLWVAFNGYWPERSGGMATATFKELEAYCVLGRLPADPPPLVVSSAGNTAAAFALLASRRRVRCVVVVPVRGVGHLRFAEPLDPCVTMVALNGADYADTIAFGESLVAMIGGVSEGGTRNIARRAGLGTVLLAAFDEIGELPEFYFQAVGSGAGAIGVHETAQRLVRAGVASRTPRLMLGQNAAFAPLYDAWHRRPKGPVAAVPPVFAAELTNRRPPYAVRGGVRDCLSASGGDMLVADGAAAHAAGEAFRRLEGVDIEPAAAVAVACLQQAVRARRVPPDATVLLNVTGGGRLRAHADAVPAPVLTAEAGRVADPAFLRRLDSAYDGVR